LDERQTELGRDHGFDTGAEQAAKPRHGRNGWRRVHSRRKPERKFSALQAFEKSQNADGIGRSGLAMGTGG
jgi:hypothetical protein